jgi:hypothetical protein
LGSPAEQVDVITTVVVLVAENRVHAAPLSFGSTLMYSR